MVLLLWPSNFSRFGIKLKKRRNLEASNNKDMKLSIRVGQIVIDTERICSGSVHFAYNSISLSV
jgi:hypothetical protein